ncbi:MAG: glycosyltransferase family A protein [Formivibrio sp.]|nr:glycosyltransferase family A protein [Formivibrio sp.]
MEKIAIFLPVHNEEKYLNKTIDSILCQDYGNFDLIISENYSTDHTAEIAANFQEKDARIKIIRPNGKLNSFGNLNFSVEYICKGNYFASMMLGGHDLISKNVLSSCISCLIKNPNASIAYQANSFEIDEEDNITRKWPTFHESGHMNSVFDATLTILSLMYNTPIFGLWRQTVREKVKFRYPCVGADHLYIAEAVSRGPILPCTDAEVYLRRSPVTDNYLGKHFAIASGDEAATKDMLTQLSWLIDIVEKCTTGYPEYARALHKTAAISLYLMRYNHHFQTFGTTIQAAFTNDILTDFINKQIAGSDSMKYICQPL